MAEIMADLDASSLPFFYGGSDVASILDRISIEHRSRFPSTDVHDGRFSDTCSAQFASRRPAEIVQDEPHIL